MEFSISLMASPLALYDASTDSHGSTRTDVLMPDTDHKESVRISNNTSTSDAESVTMLYPSKTVEYSSDT